MRPSVHDDLWCELEEDKLEKADGESEASPIGSVLEDLQAVTIEFDIAIEVLVVESLHRDLRLSTIPQSIGLVLEGKVMLDWAPGQSNLLISARAEARRHSPERNKNWDRGEDGEEDGRLQASTNLPRGICWHDEEQCEEDGIGEGFAARPICWERCVLDRRIL